MDFEIDRFLEKIGNKINPNPKRRMTVDMQRKLTRASIAFDKIEQCIRNIDLDLDNVIKKNINHSSNNTSTIRFIKNNISNQYYIKKINICKNYIEAFEKEFDDTLFDERILKSFGSSKIKLVFLPEIKGLVKKLEHTLHVKENELINSGKIILELDLDDND
jgi:hypothetical protein